MVTTPYKAIKQELCGILFRWRPCIRSFDRRSYGNHFGGVMREKLDLLRQQIMEDALSQLVIWKFPNIRALI